MPIDSHARALFRQSSRGGGEELLNDRLPEGGLKPRRDTPMGRPTIYGRRVRIYVTTEQLAAINREAALTGVTPSEVMRAALTAWFAKEHKEAS